MSRLEEGDGPRVSVMNEGPGHVGRGGMRLFGARVWGSFEYQGDGLWPAPCHSPRASPVATSSGKGGSGEGVEGKGDRAEAALGRVE